MVKPIAARVPWYILGSFVFRQGLGMDCRIQYTARITLMQEKFFRILPTCFRHPILSVSVSPTICQSHDNRTAQGRRHSKPHTHSRMLRLKKVIREAE